MIENEIEEILEVEGMISCQNPYCDNSCPIVICTHGTVYEGSCASCALSSPLSDTIEDAVSEWNAGLTIKASELQEWVKNNEAEFYHSPCETIERLLEKFCGGV